VAEFCSTPNGPWEAEVKVIPDIAAAAPATPEDTGDGWARWAGACADPVFVLCSGRSGSTLLRFLLDAHPELACPPETELPLLCSQLASVWSMFDASKWPGKAGAGQAGPGGPGEPVLAGLRHMLDVMAGPYLARRGAKRYCDKSLGSARHADLLLRMYPQARFVCLYRHPMDVIASGLEACPWGLNSYGFEHYIGASPGNAVAAIGRYWADHTSAILAAEDHHPGQCLRVRYEDLVAGPAETAERIFKFLGVPQVPDITARLLSHERERSGRSDFKIWNTSRISTGSVGRGWSVPASMLPGPLTATINELAGKLGYRQVDAAWGTAERPADMLAQPADRPQRVVPGPGSGPGATSPEGRDLGERLIAGLAGLDASFGSRWKPYSTEPFQVSVATPDGGAACWLVDPGAATIGPGGGPDLGPARWRVSGTAQAWRQVIGEGANLGVAFRRGDMRYIDNGDAGPGSTAADTRVAMLTELLGLTAWAQDEEMADEPAA
jgi:hypothetical protein